MRLALIAVLVACHAEPARLEHGEVTRTARVQKGRVADRVLLTGALRASSAVEMTVPRTETWQLAIRWMAEDGAQVKAGERLVEFDNSAVASKLEEKKLQLLEAQMTLKTAEDLAAMDIATKQTELRQAQLALSKSTLHADVPADLLTGRDSQERQLAKKRAEIAAKKAEQALAAAQHESALDIQVKRIELDKATRGIEAAEQTINELVLRAPREGVVVVEEHPWEGRKFHVGDTVQPGMTIVSLPDLDSALEVEAALSDVDDGRAAVGMAGTCTLDAYPTEPLACKLDELTPVARIKGEKSLRREFAVKLAIVTAQGAATIGSVTRGTGKSDAKCMRPGMSVKVELPRQPVDGVLVVPRGALVLDKTMHARLANGDLRDVKLGACDAQGCAVEAGLADGDVVRIGGGS